MAISNRNWSESTVKDGNKKEIMEEIRKEQEEVTYGRNKEEEKTAGKNIAWWNQCETNVKPMWNHRDRWSSHRSKSLLQKVWRHGDSRDRSWGHGVMAAPAWNFCRSQHWAFAEDSASCEATPWGRNFSERLHRKKPWFTVILKADMASL
jgi:hypothetical protein